MKCVGWTPKTAVLLVWIKTFYNVLVASQIFLYRHSDYSSVSQEMKTHVYTHTHRLSCFLISLVSAEDLKQSGMETLEHVAVTVTINHPCRGNVEIVLICPSGMPSVIGARRAIDRYTNSRTQKYTQCYHYSLKRAFIMHICRIIIEVADIYHTVYKSVKLHMDLRTVFVHVLVYLSTYSDPAGYQDWTFSTVRCWGEGAKGQYTLKISDHSKTLLNTLMYMTRTVKCQQRDRDYFWRVRNAFISLSFIVAIVKPVVFFIVFFTLCIWPACNPPLSVPVEEPSSVQCAAVGVLKEWKLTLYGSSMTYSEVKDRRR